MEEQGKDTEGEGQGEYQGAWQGGKTCKEDDAGDHFMG